MIYFLLAALALLILGIVWGALGFGICDFCLIKNDKIIANGLVMFLGSCTICWTIWISYVLGFLSYKVILFISYLMGK